MISLSIRILKLPLAGNGYPTGPGLTTSVSWMALIAPLSVVWELFEKISRATG